MGLSRASIVLLSCCLIAVLSGITADEIGAPCAENDKACRVAGIIADFTGKPKQQLNKALLRDGKEDDALLINVLLKLGAETDTINTEGSTPLHVAAENNAIKAAEVLIKGGSDLEAEDNRGNHALHVATLNNHLDMVKLLLESGANIDATGDKRMTPLQIAAHNGHTEIAQMGALLQIRKLPLYHIYKVVLIDNGADLRSKDAARRNSLQIADANGHEQITKIIFNKAKEELGFKNLEKVLMKESKNGD